MLNFNKNKKINFDFLVLFLLSLVVSYGLKVNFIYFLFLLPIAFLSYLLCMNVNLFISYGLISTIPFLLSFAIKDYSLFENLNRYIDWIFHISIRNELISFVNKSYDKDTSGLICLLLFNYKNSNNYQLYRELIDLSIVHLIVVGGFHLNVVLKLLNKAFKRLKILNNLVSFIVIFWFTYLLNFSASITRVLITMVLTKVFAKVFNNNFDRLFLSAILTIFIDYHVAFNYGFLLSYFCTYFVISIHSLNFNNKVIKHLIVNLVTTMVSLPLVIIMNKKISLFGTINSFLLADVFLFLFMYFGLSFWMFFIGPVHYGISWAIVNYINLWTNMNIFIAFSYVPNIINIGYYYLTLFTIIFTYKKNRLRCYT